MQAGKGRTGFRLGVRGCRPGAGAAVGRLFPLARAAELCVERVARLLLGRAFTLVGRALLQQRRAAEEADGMVGERSEVAAQEACGGHLVRVGFGLGFGLGLGLGLGFGLGFGSKCGSGSSGSG